MESQSNWGNSMWNVTSDHFKNSLSNYHLVKNDNKYWLFHKSDESFNAWIDKKSNKFFMNSWPSHSMSFEETMKMYFDMFSVMSASESMMYEFSEKEALIDKLLKRWTELEELVDAYEKRSIK